MFPYGKIFFQGWSFSKICLCFSSIMKFIEIYTRTFYECFNRSFKKVLVLLEYFNKNELTGSDRIGSSIFVTNTVQFHCQNEWSASASCFSLVRITSLGSSCHPLIAEPAWYYHFWANLGEKLFKLVRKFVTWLQSKLPLFVSGGLSYKCAYN